MVGNGTSLGKDFIAILFGSVILTGLLTVLLFFQTTAALFLFSAFALIFYTIAVYSFRTFGYFAFLALSFVYPSVQLYTGFSQFGVVLDIILLFTVGVIFLKTINNPFEEVQKKFYQYKIFWVWLSWLLFSLVLQLLNYNNVNWLSFIYGIRRHHLNPVGLVLINILFIRTKRDLKIAVLLNVLGCVILGLIAERQFIFGFNSFEDRLLQTRFGLTHLLPDSTRYWGGFTDAAGAGVGLTLATLSLFPFFFYKNSSLTKPWLWVAIAFLFHASLITGTRAAFASLGAGLAIIGFFFLQGRRQFSMFFALATFTALLRFTAIGQNYAIIRRFRSVFNSEDASLVVRLMNRDKLSDWILANPFGGGIGGSYFDKRFDPTSFLSTFPPDGLYVMMKSELGLIGMYFFEALLILILIYMVVKTVQAPRNSDKRIWMSICIALFVAARVSDYAQMVTFQFPVVNLLFLTMVVFEKFEKWPSKVLYKPKKTAPWL